MMGFARLRLFVLVAPVMMLAFGWLIIASCFSLVAACFNQIVRCLNGVVGQPWLMWGMAVLTGLVVLAGILMVMRWITARWYLFHRSVPAPSTLQEVVADLAERLGVSPPRLRVLGCDRPLAWTIGLVYPIIVLSPWMLHQLDAREIEGVIAHELAHIARRDHRWLFLMTWLRDAFWYVPASRLAFLQWRIDQEFACDALAAQITRRPLALASALAKVWHAGACGTLRVVSLTGADRQMEERIARLTTASCPTTARSLSTDDQMLLHASRAWAACLLALASCVAMAAVSWLL